MQESDYRVDEELNRLVLEESELRESDAAKRAASADGKVDEDPGTPASFYFGLTQAKLSLRDMLRGNGVMDSALACCTGSPGSIPAVGKSNAQYSDGFSPSRYWWKVKKWCREF